MTRPDPAAAEPVGSVAEEAFKLFRAVASGDHARMPSATEEPDPSAPADHVCSTAWCPVCQVVGFVRANPDAVAHVSQSAAVFARSLRDLVDTALITREQK